MVKNTSLSPSKLKKSATISVESNLSRTLTGIGSKRDSLITNDSLNKSLTDGLPGVIEDVDAETLKDDTANVSEDLSDSQSVKTKSKKSKRGDNLEIQEDAAEDLKSSNLSSFNDRASRDDNVKQIP